MAENLSAGTQEHPVLYSSWLIFDRSTSQKRNRFTVFKPDIIYLELTFILFPMTQTKKNLNVTEDWASVIIGFFIIIATVAGLQLPVPTFTWNSLNGLFSSVLTSQNLLGLLIQFALIYVVTVAGTILMGKGAPGILKAFPIVYLLTILASIAGGYEGIKSLNLETVIFCLFLGLAIRNFIKLPEWFYGSLSSEFFVKIGLVLLGISVIFSDILKSGSLGLIQSLIVVLSVWYFSFWLCRKLKVDKEMSMMLSSAVSICGVSAAIATSGAIKGDSKKLSLVVSLVLITAIPMMIFMPWIAHKLGLSQEVTGAWLGGTIDTTGAVVASGSLVGETALKISTIVKFSQNVLLGIAAFAISIYWSYTRKEVDKEEKPTLKVIWERFPKFVLGFILVSVIFSFFVSPEVTNAVKPQLKNLQGLWFALAFTCIGLETNFRDLFGTHNRKPMLAFLGAQTFNILVTLVIAYLLFK